MRRLILLLLGLTAALVLVPATAVADSATHTYMLFMEEPNFGVAPNGDHIAISGDVEFTVNPKSVVEGGGSFTHTNAGGTVLATGTWEATQLLDYQSYGCGVVFGDPIPPDLCGGKVKLSVMLDTPLGELPGTLTVFCVIGPNPPDSIFAGRGEGATLSVPGVINFNESAGGDNVIIQVN
jgi:hypothetical protein